MPMVIRIKWKMMEVGADSVTNRLIFFMVLCLICFDKTTATNITISTDSKDICIGNNLTVYCNHPTNSLQFHINLNPADDNPRFIDRDPNSPVNNKTYQYTYLIEEDDGSNVSCYTAMGGLYSEIVTIHVIYMIPKLDNVSTEVTCDGVVIQWSAPDLNSNYDTDGYMIVIEALNYTSSQINNTVFEEEISLEHFEINKMYYIQISEVVCDILTNFTSLPPVVIATIPMMVDPVLGNETLDPDNETHSHTRFSPQVANIDCEVSYPTEVSIITTCDNTISVDHRNVSVGTNGSIEDFIIVSPINQTCVILLQWKNGQNDIFNSSNITILSRVQVSVTTRLSTSSPSTEPVSTPEETISIIAAIAEAIGGGIIIIALIIVTILIGLICFKKKYIHISNPDSMGVPLLNRNDEYVRRLDDGENGETNVNQPIYAVVQPGIKKRPVHDKINCDVDNVYCDPKYQPAEPVVYYDELEMLTKKPTGFSDKPAGPVLYADVRQ